jgi:hypothetical protein
VTERLRLDAVNRDPFSVDLDHRDPLAIPPLELGDARDVDLDHLEPELAGEARELFPGPLAEMAVPRDDKADGLQGYNPRMVLASATRPTPSP